MRMFYLAAFEAFGCRILTLRERGILLVGRSYWQLVKGSERKKQFLLIVKNLTYNGTLLSLLENNNEVDIFNKRVLTKISKKIKHDMLSQSNFRSSSMTVLRNYNVIYYLLINNHGNCWSLGIYTVHSRD